MEGEIMRNCDDKFTYIGHMLAEHRRLDALVRGVLATIPCWEENVGSEWLPPLVKRLHLVREELVHHFRDEEEGGCLEEAVARCPELAPHVRLIEEEHPRLLDRLDEVIRHAEQAAEHLDVAGPMLAQEFRTLVRDLRAHEAQENRILQQGFNYYLEPDFGEQHSVLAD
jgi:hypothetical protein